MAIEEVLDMEVPGNIREYESLGEIVDRLNEAGQNLDRMTQRKRC